MLRDDGARVRIWRAGPALFAAGLGAVLLVFGIYQETISRLIERWSGSEEYGYGFLIPFISAFLVWQRSDELRTKKFSGSWVAVGLLVIGLGIYFSGRVATVHFVMQYALVLCIMALAWALVGKDVFKRIWVPLALLAFAIPLPTFLYRGLSAALQLISTDIGVWVIRLFDISVYVEGNVIDLGQFKLQVVEACSGLRYLFPLTSLAFIAAYLFNGAWWKKAIIFLSSIPITVLMNSFRIGMIGVLVEYWGIEQAEGFLHDFEGWVVFMACIGLLIVEMWALAKIGPDRKTLAEAFAIEFPAPPPKDAEVRVRGVPAPFIASIALLGAALAASLALGQRDEVIPDRKVFAEFTGDIEGWEGRRDRLESIYLDALKLDDYYIGDFKRPGDPAPVNFYVAYYASQRAGESAHSPRSCIPGGGWQIAELREVTLDDVTWNGQPLRVNRLVIELGDTRQLVYYWFQQRGRNITNEYAVKWYLLEDAIRKNRTDGALVRLITPVAPGEPLEAGDARLRDFARAVVPVLKEYVPD
ncbi:VPLPA-CTERM-specific exosortase XrtD [Thiohalobacter sp.]|uniref:VPLPA-CTERM-specific exosortase XrtD n=1 Tax=Thiohalobacter sp. TaxID=2025948 RepID=UPI00262DDA11|nr:VPLPA-CTERM-specific exosortase XrtD [Thiohalobacter sp.]